MVKNALLSMSSSTLCYLKKNVLGLPKLREVEIRMGINTNDCSSKRLSYFTTGQNLYITGGYDKLVNHIGKPFVKRKYFDGPCCQQE